MQMVYNLTIITLMGLIAIIAGIFEDLESDVASTSNPNSQVQLAPQLGNLHKYFNRAISGEPLLVGTMSVISGSLCYVLMTQNYNILLIMILSSLIATMVQVLFSISSYTGRITSQSLYNQPLFMDVLKKHLPTSAAHAFISLFSITLLSYLITNVVLPTIPIALPVMSLFIGVTLGSIGSAVGDIHYGAEKLYQNVEFGSGVAVSNNGNITTKSALGSTNSIDVVDFCSKFGGPLTGLCFGLIIFLNFWTITVFGVYGGIIAGVIIVLLFVLLNLLLERYSRSTYGKYGK